MTPEASLKQRPSTQAHSLLVSLSFTPDCSISLKECGHFVLLIQCLTDMHFLSCIRCDSADSSGYGDADRGDVWRLRGLQ